MANSPFAFGTTLEPTSIPGRGPATIAFLLWAAFVVYGSLLPFAYTPRSLAQVLAAFQAIPILAIGPDGRADWLANLLLYAPLAFLAMWVFDSASRPMRTLAALIVVIALTGLAIAVEFVQLYFPPRTVSANDLVAEFLGIALGTFAWLQARRHIIALSANYVRGGSQALRTLAIVYVVLYALLALLPFDFLLAPSELAQKAFVEQAGWWTAPRGCVRLFPCTLQLGTEAMLAFPLGLAFVAMRGRTLTLGALVFCGLLLGAAIELVQLTLASGVSQGTSVLAKAAGFVGGGLVAPGIHAGWQRLRQWRLLPVAIGVLGLAYVIVLSVVLGFWRTFPLHWIDARARLNEVVWMPLYHYYYTSETHALASALVQAALYAPMGALLAVGARTLRPLPAMTLTAITAAGVAIVAQAARLFDPPQKPDLTDVMIAVVAALAGYRLTRLLMRLLDGEITVAATSRMEPPAATITTQADVLSNSISVPREDTFDGSPPSVLRERTSDAGLRKRQSSWSWRLLALILGAAVVWSLVAYPLNRAVLVGVIVVYVAVLVRWPDAWYVVLPAALPVADLAGWSGRLYFSEFDRLVLVTLAVAAWRGPPPPQFRGPRHFPLVLVILVAVSVLVGLSRGLLPLAPLDANAFATYISHYNALRIGKGLLWAVALCVLARREGLPSGQRSTLFAYGLALGTALVIAIVVWERFVFTGIANFAHQYRVTGPFWEMNTGGAYIEGYLVATLPFVVYLLATQRSALVRLGALGVFLAGTYAVLVTMSRNGFAALAVTLAILCFGLVAHFARARGGAGGVKGLAGALALVVLTGVVAVPILTGATLKGRFATIEEDLKTRRDHWALALDLRGNSAANEWLGMGLGRFPETYFWGSGRTRPSSYRFLEEGGRTFLRLGGGESLYFEQFVDVDPASRYTLILSLRSHLPNATFTVPICEKWLLESFECSWNNIELGGPAAGFARHAITIDSGAISKGTWYTRRPVRLTLYNPNHQNTVDIESVVLVGPDGTNRVANGDFARGMDHWHFSTDTHLPWHIKNLPLQILFDQGWLGAVAWLALIAFALTRAAAGLWRGDLFAGVTLAGLCGFLVVGVFDSMIDSPRLLLLFGLLLWLAATPRGAYAISPPTPASARAVP